jgi:hypothetical protein
VSILAIKTLKTDDRIKTLDLDSQKKTRGGDRLYYTYDWASGTLLSMTLVSDSGPDQCFFGYDYSSGSPQT